ncbi:MAG: anti-sigma factor RsiW [Phycisphaerales bacterium]|jgi:anti-sigma factor RsiW
MTDQPNTPNTPEPPKALSALIRAGADGELSPEDCARLEAMIAAEPDVELRVEFERQLRSGCAKAMATGPCPEALRQQVLQIAAASSEPVHAAPHPAEQMADQTRQTSFWSGSRGLMGIAAAMLLTVAGVLVWQSAGIGGSGVQGLGGGAVSAVSYRQQVAEFVTKEHARTEASASARARKFVHTDPEETRAWFVDLLGDGLTLIGLNQPVESITFKGAGKCGVPGAGYGKSAHMQFEVRGESGEPIVVSVFAAPLSADLPLLQGTTYAIDMEACGIMGYSVLAWTDGVANYFLVADEGTNGCGQTLKAAGRPEPTEKI